MRRSPLLMVILGLLFSTVTFSRESVSQGALKIRDLSLQQSLENQYYQRIRQAYPELRFGLVVTLAPSKSVELEFFSEEGRLDNDNSIVKERIKAVKIYTEKELPLEILGNLTDVKANKIKQVVTVFEEKSIGKDIKRDIASVESEKSKSLVKEQSSSTDIVVKVFLLLLVAGGAFYCINVLSKMAGGLRTIADAIQQGATPFEKAKSITKNQASSSSAPLTLSAQFKPEQLKAMLAECYWCHQDASASALIRSYPQVDAYISLRFGAAYLEYLKQVTPGDLSFMNDGYYLNPNSAFMDLSIDDTPIETLQFCSEMRFDATKYHPSEVIKAQSTAGLEAQVPKINSQLRELHTGMRIKLKNTKEETEVLSSTLSPEVLWSLPSLNRLNLLTDPQFEWVMDRVTLKELVLAWEGPEQVLVKIKNRLSSKKKEFIEQLLTKNTGSRQSAEFQKILDLCQEAKDLKPAKIDKKIAA